MSLIHWWPLIEDTIDKITGTAATATGVSQVGGKLGKAYSFSGSSGSAIYSSYNQTINPTEFSFAFWIKLDSSWSGWGQVFTVGNYGTSWNDIRIGCDISGDKVAYFSVSNGSSAIGGGGPRHSLSAGQWYHIACTYKNKVMSMYVNGSPATTLSTYTSSYDPVLSSASRISIGGNSSEIGECIINDVRIYDHALSQAEVKELSKALVVHYTFNDILAEPTTNLLPTDLQSMTVNSAPGVYGNPATINITSGLTSGVDYTLSLWQTVGSANQSTGVSTRLICYYTDGTYDDNSTAKMGITLPQDDKEYYYEVTVITNKNKTISHLGGWILDHSSGNGKVRSYRNAQIEAKGHATPYTSTSRESMLVNEAGYNGDINNCGFVLSKDAVKGSYSSYYKNGEQYLIYKNTPLNNEMVSTSVWFKSANTSPKTDYHILMSVDVGVVEISIPKNGQLRWGGYTSNNSRVCSNVTVKSSSGSTFSLLDGKWHLINTIYDGSGWYAYVDGVYQTKWNATGTISYSNKNLIIGKFSEGATSSYGATDAYIDDVKIYNTILTSDDIKDLYQTKAMISDKGDIMCNQFVESKSQAQVTSKYCFEADEFYEEFCPGYDVLEYIESTGTQYVDTGYVTTSTDYAYELDMAPTKIGGFYSYMGFMASGTIPRTGVHEYSNVFMIGADATTTSSTTPVVNERVVLKGHFKSGAQKLYKNDVLIASNSTTFNHSANTLSTYIFGRNYSSGRNLVSIKLYSAKIYEGSTLVRYYIPVRRQSDNALGLYDILTDTFCVNSGSGAFIAGPTVTNSNASIYKNQNVSGRNIIEI